MKIFLKITIFLIVASFLLFAFFYFTDTLFAPSSEEKLENRVCFNKNCFFVELVKNSAEQERGLMFRKNLDKDKGMLFIFGKEDNYPFWMKNTLIPLDIIWINKDKKVVSIKENAQPCLESICQSLNPEVLAKYVLEINGGLAKEINLKIGDLIQISPSL
jgi:uncharacterized membrane protein (UPF0127 family)